MMNKNIDGTTRFKFFSVVFIFIVIMFFPLNGFPAFADSVWSKEDASPYSTEKSYKVGDIVNIIILESTSAQNKAGSKADVRDDLAIRFTHTLARLAPFIGTNTNAVGQFSNRDVGEGQTTRSSNVQARIAGWVTDVLPNGNLVITGKHKVNVNEETQEITITGVVRAKDINGENVIYSYQVANADVSILGRGSVAETESLGWITRIFNWIF